MILQVGVPGEITISEVRALLASARHGSDEAAATELNLSIQTVKNQTYSLRKKLGVQTNLTAFYRLLGGVRVTVETRITFLEEEPT